MFLVCLLVICVLVTVMFWLDTGRLACLWIDSVLFGCRLLRCTFDAVLVCELLSLVLFFVFCFICGFWIWLVMSCWCWVWVVWSRLALVAFG